MGAVMPWVAVTDPDEMMTAEAALGAGRRTGAGVADGVPAGVRQRYETYLNRLREQAQAGQSLSRTTRSAARTIDRLGRTGKLLAAVRRLPGAFGFDNPVTADQEYLDALASSIVLDKQLDQKGQQTEADAARLALSQLSGDKGYTANKRLVADAALNARLAQNKLTHYSGWLTRYGSLDATDAKGRNADQAWQQIADLAAELKDKRLGLTTTRNNTKTKTMTLPKGWRVEVVE
jgi:hypothetical protein